MSHAPKDIHRRLEPAGEPFTLSPEHIRVYAKQHAMSYDCASGCTATAICPPGRCVKAGRVTLEQALAAPVTVETGKPRVVLPIRTELLGVKQRPECDASGPAADGTFTCDCAPGECPGVANAKLIDTALALAKGVIGWVNPAPHAAQPAVPSPSTEVQIGAGPQPVMYVSPSQVPALLKDPDGDFGHYLPTRKTPAGKFTMPLYAVPVAVAPPGWTVTAVEPVAPIPPAADSGVATACCGNYAKCTTPCVQRGRWIELRNMEAERAPLTDEQILACVRSVGLPVPMGLTRDSGPYEVTEPTWFLIQLVRAIERAHGIDAAMAQQAKG